MIRTVLGNIPGSTLGHAQCHEHLFVARTPACLAAPALLMDDTRLSINELLTYRAAGGGSVVDAQPPFAGRMSSSLLQASLSTGVHIIAVTGFHKRMFYQEDCPLFAMDLDELQDLFVGEITEGMLDDSLTTRLFAKAGLVKIAFDDAVPGGLNLMWTDAAILAAKRTGASILVHTENGSDVGALIDRVLQAGIPAQKLIICHMDRTCPDPVLHKAVLETGAYLNYDSIHRYQYISMEQELRLICEMLHAGFASQLLLSLDTTAARLAQYGGEIGLDYILTTFEDTLCAAGVDKSDIQRMTVQNPAAALQICK